MTLLSINLNKIALLRNSRGRDYPNVLAFAKKFIALGVRGITVHPREDQRHIKDQDARDLARMLRGTDVEFNMEGYPSPRFMALVDACRPTQCTLVPDAPGQLTSDHGFDLKEQKAKVREICQSINAMGVRSAIFLDPDVEQVRLAKETTTARIELYTESYAAHTGSDEVLAGYKAAAEEAARLGIGVNAGHDLDKGNLARFLGIGHVLEVSIGHALTVECIEEGMDKVVAEYLAICGE